MTIGRGIHKNSAGPPCKGANRRWSYSVDFDRAVWNRTPYCRSQPMPTASVFSIADAFPSVRRYFS